MVTLQLALENYHLDAKPWPDFDGAAEDAVLSVMRDRNVSTHPVIRELEHDFATHFNREYALAHNNGTSGLLAAFHALGLEPGDEVLVPSATFWASVLPMVWCGLVPVFCESESETLGIDPEDARRRITPRTKAMVVVHLWGVPSKMDELNAVCKEFDLRMIEDASHTHGASYHGTPCGKFGDISVFSLQGDKLVPAGEGGVLLTDSYEYYERAVLLGDITRIIELETAERRFAATSMGIKTRMAPMSAALGRVMLSEMKDRNADRNYNHSLLAEELEALGFECFLPGPGIERVWFEFIIRHRDPSFHIASLINVLQTMGARVAAPRYPLLHQQPFFTEGVIQRIGRYPENIQLPDYSSLELPITERENSRLIRLPNFPYESDATGVVLYADAFKKALKLC